MCEVHEIFSVGQRELSLNEKTYQLENFVQIRMIRWMSSKTINVLIGDENIKDNLGVRTIENKMRTKCFKMV